MHSITDVGFVPENTAHGLTLLDPDQEVVVTGEEDHQDVLRAWAPHAGPRRVAVELRPAPLRRGRLAGQPGLEALLDGRRIGELTPLMSTRYRPHVDDVLRRGGRPGAIGLVRHGRRGLVEVELRLPDLDVAPVPQPAPAPVPAPFPAPLPPAGRPPQPDAPRPSRGRFRTPALVGAGVVTLLIAIGAIAGGGQDADRVPTVPAAAPAIAPPTTTTAAPTPALPTTTPVPVTDEDETVVAAAVPAPTTRPARPAPTTTSRAPAPRPAPEPEPDPEPQSDPEPRAPETPVETSDPGPSAVSYKNCDAVRAAGAAPIRRGDPGYASHLDRDGDGEGCGGD